jgi:hypothetical protein
MKHPIVLWLYGFMVNFFWQFLKLSKELGHTSVRRLTEGNDYNSTVETRRASSLLIM